MTGRDGAMGLMASALIEAAMLRPVIFHIRQCDDPDEIVRIVNDAIDRDWLRPHQLPLLEEGIVA